MNTTLHPIVHGIVLVLIYFITGYPNYMAFIPIFSTFYILFLGYRIDDLEDDIERIRKQRDSK